MLAIVYLTDKNSYADLLSDSIFHFASSLSVLLLDPGDLQDNLSASIKYVCFEIEQTLEYETISYSWGDTSLRSTMLVDGKSLNICKSADQALHRVRKATEVRAVWIDAICINQFDVIERGHQVGMMCDIYSRGTQNLIYLGESDGYTFAGFQAVDTIKTEILTQSGCVTGIQKFMYTNTGRPRERLDMLPGSLHDIEALFRLYCRPWFSRLWVLQEAALSPLNVCICGDLTIPLFDVLAAATHIISNYELQTRYGEKFSAADHMFHHIYRGYPDALRRGHIQRDLSSLLNSSRRYRVSVEQDRAFALLGLIPMKSLLDKKHVKPLLNPDYARSVPEVIMDASRAALVLDSNVKLLGTIRHRTQSDVSGHVIPSWALNLRREPERKERSRLYLVEYASSLHLPAQIVSAVPSNILTLRGLSLDQSLTLGPVYEYEMTSSQLCDFLEASAIVAGCQLSDDRRSEVFQSFSRTLTVGLLLKGQQTAIGMSQGFLGWLNSINMDDCNSNESDESIGIYRKAIAKACANRRVFCTKSNLLGLGPQHMQDEDKVVVFYGSRWPSILRPARDRAQHHFVGNCYIDGLMDGEAAREYHQIFHLR